MNHNLPEPIKCRLLRLIYSSEVRMLGYFGLFAMY